MTRQRLQTRSPTAQATADGAFSAKVPAGILLTSLGSVVRVPLRPNAEFPQENFRFGRYRKPGLVLSQTPGNCCKLANGGGGLEGYMPYPWPFRETFRRPSVAGQSVRGLQGCRPAERAPDVELGSTLNWLKSLRLVASPAPTHRSGSGSYRRMKGSTPFA